MVTLFGDVVGLERHGDGWHALSNNGILRLKATEGEMALPSRFRQWRMIWTSMNFEIHNALNKTKDIAVWRRLFNVAMLPRQELATQKTRAEAQTLQPQRCGHNRHKDLRTDFVSLPTPRLASRHATIGTPYTAAQPTACRQIDNIE